MRVLFLDHTAALGGGEIALLNLLTHFDRDQMTPVVAVFSDGPLVPRLRNAGIETLIFPLGEKVTGFRKDNLGSSGWALVKAAASSIAFIWQLASLIRRQRVQLVHTNSLKSDLLGGIAARLAGVKVVWHVRDRIAEDYLPRRVVHVFRFLCRIIPHHIITISQATLRTIIPDPNKNAATRALAARTHVVYDGTPLVELARTPRAINPLQVVGLVGRLSRWKGQHIFLHAAALVLQQFKNVRFQIIGDALFSEQDYALEVKHLATTLNLHDHVEFTGFRSDVASLIAQLDILVHASITGEPFGQVVIEAMAAAKPVIATNGGGIPEIVVDRVTGILVPMGDAVQMADAILSLLHSPHEIVKMGNYGRARFLEKFTSRKTANSMQVLLGKLISANTKKKY
jgi:glycosyltransferase involved in cell wall biosynthesis